MRASPHRGRGHPAEHARARGARAPFRIDDLLNLHVSTGALLAARKRGAIDF